MAKSSSTSLANGEPQSKAKSVAEQQSIETTSNYARSQPVTKQTTTIVPNIVEEENLQFIRQIKAQVTMPRKPRRQIKLVHDSKKV
jgi:uncharacterized protein with NAD-binding domain and iron-sulfur cluster